MRSLRLRRATRLALSLTLAALAAVGLARGALAQVREAGQTFRAGPVTLYYEVRGARAGTPLVMVNGGPGFEHSYVHCSSAWDVIARRRPVVFYDQRGNGRSSPLKPGQSCTLADQIADLEALRAQLHCDRFDLIGHSWGGYLVMAYAARHPERVSHLIICDSAAPKWEDTVFLFKDVFPEGMERQRSVGFAETLGDSAALATDIREYLAMLFWSPENRDRFLANASSYKYTRAINEAINADLSRFDLNPELPKFRFPTLVITGRYDMNVAPSVAWKIHKAIPDSRFVVFERSGHLPYFEEPEAFVKTIEEFLGPR